MAIIGRLDEQTEALLIAPLRRRDEPAVDTRADPNAQTEEQRAANELPSADEAARRKERAELPVWLL